MNTNNKEVHIRKKLDKLLRSRSIKARVKIRRRKNSILKIAGRCSIGLCLLFLIYILFNICSNCYYALIKVEVLLPITITKSDPGSMIKEGLKEILHNDNDNIISSAAVWYIENFIRNNPNSIGKKLELWLPASNNFSKIAKHHKQSETKNKLMELNKIKISFNNNLFSHADSQHPEYAGIAGALIGSLLTISICFVCALPIGILTGIYLQEFKFKNKIISSIIEISINNLSATPAIIFGIVGLYFYISFLGMPRSSALVGGLVLSLMMLPILVISTRQALSTISTGIKEAALALGASKTQVILHHSLPMAFPNIITGAILAVARVLAESAPLLMVGMAAFIADVPRNILEPTTVFPLQIYIWASNPNNTFTELNSILMLVLLVILLALNIVATVIRRRMYISNN
ncbi:MAG: phosphate ABC transporter permease PstA [Rickettsiaceae bacterium H1]|nr:phosphate ABC transporter permease PstA [Rickettsiaceae bacterium H1]